jgi:hypothetical protein
MKKLIVLAFMQVACTLFLFSLVVSQSTQAAGVVMQEQHAPRMPSTTCIAWQVRGDNLLKHWNTSHGFVQLVDRPNVGGYVVREEYDGTFEVVGTLWSSEAAYAEALARAKEHTDLGTPFPMPSLPTPTGHR